MFYFTFLKIKCPYLRLIMIYLYDFDQKIKDNFFYSCPYALCDLYNIIPLFSGLINFLRYILSILIYICKYYHIGSL